MTTSGIEALATDCGISFSAETVHGHVDDRRVDEWELKASRRALINLKDLLYGAAMMELLGGQLAEADDIHRKYLAESDGKYAATQVIARATGLSTEQFFPFLLKSFMAFSGDVDAVRGLALNLAFPAHPEHYAVPPYRGAVETMGGLVTRTRVGMIENPPDFIAELIDESYPFRVAGQGTLEDGTPHSYVLQQFKDTEDGMEINLRVWYPAACPPRYLEDHAEHYTVEFRNFLRLAAAGREE